MATPAQFEEKEYEQPLNVELLLSNVNPLWSPGQVLEEHFGFDAAMLADHPLFWRAFGFRNVPEGVILDDFRWPRIWRRIGGRRPLPRFRVNLLLQTKRPSFARRVNTRYSKQGITGSYWQFQTMQHQQEALERLHHTLGNRALVCYACAAFHTLNDLYTNIRNHTIVDNSTFVQIHRMSTHKKWVYDTPGSVGLACSKIERVEHERFNELLSISANSEYSDNDPLRNLVSFEKAIIQNMNEIGDNPIANEFNQRREFLTSIISQSQENNEQRAALAFSSIVLFSTLTNSSWFCVR